MTPLFDLTISPESKLVIYKVTATSLVYLVTARLVNNFFHSVFPIYVMTAVRALTIVTFECAKNHRMIKLKKRLDLMVIALHQEHPHVLKLSFLIAVLIYRYFPLIGMVLGGFVGLCMPSLSSHCLEEVNLAIFPN